MGYLDEIKGCRDCDNYVDSQAKFCDKCGYKFPAQELLDHEDRLARKIATENDRMARQRYNEMYGPRSMTETEKWIMWIGIFIVALIIVIALTTHRP